MNSWRNCKGPLCSRWRSNWVQAPSRCKAPWGRFCRCCLALWGHNATQPQGVADLLGGWLGAGAGNSDGAALLGQILGGARGQVESQLGQASGLGDKIGPLLTMLAPLVLQFLSQRAGNLDAASVGQLLGQETARVPQPGGVAGGLLGSLLDQNGDGKLDAGDLFKLGAGLFGKR